MAKQYTVEFTVTRMTLTADGACDGLVHLHPAAGDPHVTAGADCWCRPNLYRRCTQCEGDAGCWACYRGWVAVDAASPGDLVVVAHHCQKPPTGSPP